MLIPPNMSPLIPPILLVKNLPAIITKINVRRITSADFTAIRIIIMIFPYREPAINAPKFLENKIIPLRVALVWPESDELSEKASVESRKILSAANIIERYIEDTVNILVFFSFIKADARLFPGWAGLYSPNK